LPAAGDTAIFCLPEGTVTFNGQQVSSAVWWSGGVGARTGCHADGTNCLTGDCNTNPFAPNQDCPVGVGGQQPATIAEFTLQTEATDFYDITAINGANIGEQMGPLPTSTQTPGAVPTFYWCSTPGGNCKFDYGTFTASVPLAQPIDGTPLLMLIAQGCTQGPAPAAGCPSGFQCNGNPGATNGVCFMQCTLSAQCPLPQQCVMASNGNSYCQCSKQSDCPAGEFCGSQFIPGVGIFQQQCGSFEGWWSADDFCGNASNIIGNPSNPVLNCGAMITNGDGGSTNLSQLFGCTGANATSCYQPTATSGCCGCATSSANSLFSAWPTETSLACVSNNPVWAADTQPWLANLKQACPSAYSYPFDDATNTFQCEAQGSTNLLGYSIRFTDLPKPTSE
jgi:hypothetical protein